MKLNIRVIIEYLLYIFVVFFLTRLLAYQKLGDFNGVDPHKISLVREWIVTTDLPAGTRVATPWICELIYKKIPGMEWYEDMPKIYSNFFFYTFWLILLTVPFFIGFNNLWTYIGIFSIYYILSFNKVINIRLSDYPGILLTNIVFGLLSYIYLEISKIDIKYFSLLFIFSIFASFFRENIIFSLFFAIFVFLITISYHLLYNKISDLKKPLIHTQILAIIAIVFGIFIGKMILLLIFPEIKNLQWQKLGGVQNGTMLSDMKFYYPYNQYHFREIISNIFFHQYIFIILSTLFLFYFSKKILHKNIALASFLLIISNFLVYYFFGGIAFEGFEQMSLILGINFPIILSFKQCFTKKID